MRNCVLRDYSDCEKPLGEDPQKLEKKKQEIWHKIRRADPLIAQQVQVEAIDFQDIVKLLPDLETAILSFYNTGDQTYIFILRRTLQEAKISLHHCSNLDYLKLEELLDKKWLTLYQNNKNLWREALSDNLKTISQHLALEKLINDHLLEIKELIIIPHLGFHHIPFSALPLNLDDVVMANVSPRSESSRLTVKNSIKFKTAQISLHQKCLGDLFRIRIVPSCQILKHCVERSEIQNPVYGVVEDATENLKFPNLEISNLKKLEKISSKNHLKGKREATVKNYKALLKRVENIHSSHHAYSDLSNPQNSALVLGDGYFSLGSLMLNRYPNLNHVFLSCCETNLGKPNLTDDLLTLGTGFLCAGARTVISSLWAVDDLATAIFSSYYYQALNQTQKPSLALQQAQKTLRQVTWDQLRNDFPDLKTDIDIEKEELARRQGVNLQKKDISQSPFIDPYYWSGFICQGV